MRGLPLLVKPEQTWVTSDPLSSVPESDLSPSGFWQGGWIRTVFGSSGHCRPEGSLNCAQRDIGWLSESHMTACIMDYPRKMILMERT